MTPLKLLALIVTVLLAVQPITAIPHKKPSRQKPHKENKPKSSTTSKSSTNSSILTGEHPTQKLSEDVPQAHGLALNWTTSVSTLTINRNARFNDGVAVLTSTVNTIQFFGRLAAVAYCDFVNTFTCGSYCNGFPGTVIVKTFNTPKTSTIGYIARNDGSKAIYVTYRGSSNLVNFIYDLQFSFDDYSPAKNGARVHSGFLASYRDARDIVYNTVVDQMAKHPGYTLYMIGHSLGSAVAVLQTLDFYNNAGYNNRNMIIYTFGQPRIGNPAFASYVDSLGLSFHRTINQNDIVPHVPPMLFGYKHHTSETWIEDSQGDVVLCSTVEDSTCSNSVIPWTTSPSPKIFAEPDLR
ncbi:Alpha/Beta hydrolase protein [Jimgerdemannia flammicorona]|uniref:Alpha/Beta hydrolase protein n=1 Tax=Jimgerdemannia flammicorona TaxID=994334 RepID=A0A433D7R9_9FUNG|nr:Alpha/Beta hydrolase protein [Jimgerdemannia flammicorona]